MPDGPGPGGPGGFGGPPRGGWGPPRGGRGPRGGFRPPHRHHNYNYDYDEQDFEMFSDLIGEIKKAKIEKNSILKGTLYGIGRYFKKPFVEIGKLSPDLHQHNLFTDAEFDLGFFELYPNEFNADKALNSINKLNEGIDKYQLMQRYNAVIENMNSNNNTHRQTK